MLSAPSYSGTKVGAVFYGLAAGLATFIGIVFVSVLLGVLLAWFSALMMLGEYKPWLSIIFGEYSMVPGIVLGAIVCWRIWRARLRHHG
jgi:hypothetical protein